jgi:Flp pilus assembly protein TadG
MKKIILILVAIIGVAFYANAEDTKTCKVRGTDRGTVNVSVYESDTQNGAAIVSLNNDTSENVNVYYEVDFYRRRQGVEYNDKIIGTRSGSKIAKPGQETPAQLSIGIPYDYAKIRSISGEKCN